MSDPATDQTSGPVPAVRVAIIGSGPAGAYAAGHLLRHTAATVHVDMYERLPTPWGLVRSGVAPDHPKIKSVTRLFEKTAAHPRFHYFGNVEFGRHVRLEQLRERYDAIIYAVGTPGDRPLGIPGEDLAGSWAATDFVGWYNGHPDYADLEFDLGCERAVVVGAGNVALDVARMLLLPHPELVLTDTADHALDALEHSSVREVVVVARRGPEQAAFTNPELLELGELEDTDVIVDPADLAVADALPDPAADATARRNLEILRGYAAREPQGRRRRIVLRFLTSPAEIRGDRRVEGIDLVRNELYAAQDGSLRARSTDQRLALDTGLVLRAIGYRGTPLPDVPFDEVRGVIPNERGRVRSGEYVVGWAKRGPSGVIGTNKKDANETVDTLLADLVAGELPPPPQPCDDAEIEEFVRERQAELVTFAGWEEIDRHEQSQGEPHGRPRVKLTRVEHMLDVARPWLKRD